MNLTYNSFNNRRTLKRMKRSRGKEELGGYYDACAGEAAQAENCTSGSKNRSHLI